MKSDAQNKKPAVLPLILGICLGAVGTIGYKHLALTTTDDNRAQQVFYMLDEMIYNQDILNKKIEDLSNKLDKINESTKIQNRYR